MCLQNPNNSDDEDLEQLRLAALKSIKKSTTTTINNEGAAKKCYNGNNAASQFHTALHYNKKSRGGYVNRNTRMVGMKDSLYYA